MAIDLNVNKYGAQFSAFVDFAKKATDENTIVCVSDDRNKTQEENRQEFENRLLGIDGTPRTITAKTDGDSKGKFWRDGDSKRLNKDVRGLFLRTVLAVCGVQRMEDLPQAVLDVMRKDDFEADGRPLTVRRIRAVTNAILANAGASANQTIAAAFVSGKDTAAVQHLQRIVATAPFLPAGATPEEKAAAFAAKLSENVAKIVTTKVTHVFCKSFLGDKAGNFDNEHGQFKIDQKRDMKVYIDDRDKRDDISKDYETARDKLVRFITGNDEDTFEDATESVKRQTGLLMSFLTQYTATSVMSGFLSTIERKGVNLQFAGATTGRAETEMDFTLGRTAAGDIQITLGKDLGAGGIGLTDEKGSEMYMLDGDTSRCRVGMEIILPADNFREVAEADWAALDYDAFEAVPTGNADAQIALIPKPLRLNAQITASAHFELNPHPAFVNDNNIITT